MIWHRSSCWSVQEIKKLDTISLSPHLQNQKPSPATPTTTTTTTSTWCQPGEIQSQKLYHEWCIRWKNAFTPATTQWAVVANTVMEKCEGYRDENVLWNREDICECCLLLSWGSTTEDISTAYKEIPQYFYKGRRNLSWSPRGALQRVSLHACVPAHLRCMHKFCLLLLARGGKGGCARLPC